MVAPVLLLGLLSASAATLAPDAKAALERAMFGNTFSRNMVSDEKGLPGDWDVKAGRNVKWWADVGSQAYAGPVIAGGKVFVGTNNDGLRNPALPNDRGVVMAISVPPTGALSARIDRSVCLSRCAPALVKTIAARGHHG
jgi:hypothetical protein